MGAARGLECLLAMQAAVGPLVAERQGTLWVQDQDEEWVYITRRRCRR